MKQYIVFQPASGNLLSLMKDTDDRFCNGTYFPLTEAVSAKKKQRANNGFIMRVYNGGDGHTYGVFKDKSARCLSNNKNLLMK